MQTGIRIDYKVLRRVNPEAARLAVAEYLESCQHNITATARAFGITRPVVYDIVKRYQEGDLTDRSRAPKHQPQKTPVPIEEAVVAAKNKIRLGPRRLSIYLAKYQGLQVPYGTIRHILRRNHHRLTYLTVARHRRDSPRPFVDWYAAKPFEIVQVDVKFIRDHKALTKEQIIHLDQYAIPNYQWGALDVNSRFKLIAYSREKTWTNGLCFYLWAISWLRSHGVRTKIVFTVDHGEEFGGKSWLKVQELRKLIAGFDCKLIQNHKGHCEENAHLERSHRTDDEEFYIPRTLTLKSEDDLLHEATGYIYYYNNLREHSALGYQPPYLYLKQQLPDLDHNIRLVVPILLDEVAVALGPWSGYNVLAQNQIQRTTVDDTSLAGHAVSEPDTQKHAPF
jgi:transposase-like protein